MTILNTMFDIIAIDWGSVRFGLAFGSSATKLILPCKQECFTAKIWQILEQEIKQRNPKLVVIGKPTTFDLKPTQITFLIDKFTTEFQVRFPNIPIHIINERESTKKALQKNREVTKHELNHNSACEILSLYLGR